TPISKDAAKEIQERKDFTEKLEREFKELTANARKLTKDELKHKENLERLLIAARIPENEVIRVFYGEGDAKPFDRSISRMRWLHDKIGTLGFAFQAEDNGYIRQFIFALRGAGMLATLDSPGSEQFTEFGSDLGKMAWVRSSFDEPPSIRCLVKNQNS